MRIVFIILTGIIFASKIHPVQSSGSINLIQERLNKHSEFINIDSILINEVISFKSTPQALKRYFNTPDSIKPRENLCVGYYEVEKSEIYYYGLSVFERYADTVILGKIDFRDGRFKMRTTKITLHKNTTLAECKQAYPNSTKQASDWVDVNTNKTYKLVRISPDAKSSDEWHLKFDGEKLIEIEYWMPC